MFSPRLFVVLSVRISLMSDGVAFQPSCTAIRLVLSIFRGMGQRIQMHLLGLTFGPDVSVIYVFYSQSVVLLFSKAPLF